MSNLIGTPDGSYGVISPQVKLMDVGSGGAVKAVSLPASCETLVIMFHGGGSYYVTSVVGATSGTAYPVFAYGENVSGGDSPMWVCPVAPSKDSSVTITVAGSGAPAWTIYADTGIRVVADATLVGVLGNPGGLVPPSGLMVMGSDGSDSIFLAVNADGTLRGQGWPPSKTALSNFSANLVGSGTITTTTGNGWVIWWASYNSSAADQLRVGGNYWFVVTADTNGAVQWKAPPFGFYVPTGTAITHDESVSSSPFTFWYEQL